MWNQIENQLLIKFKQNQKIKNKIGDVRFSLANHQITPGNWFKYHSSLKMYYNTILILNKRYNFEFLEDQVINQF